MTKAIIRKTWITLAGLTVILVGAALLILPGPGLIVIAAGLAILATEYAWAQKLLDPLKKRLEQARDKLTEIIKENQQPKDR